MLRFMGCQRVRHDWATELNWYCTGVFLSGLLHSIIGSSFIHFIRTDSNVFFLISSVQFSSVQSLSRVRLFVTPWIAACQASLSITNSRSSFRFNQSNLKEIGPGCSLEGLMLKLKLQYFGHLMRRADSLQKTLMLGGIGGRRKRGRQRMRRLDGITDSMDMSLSELRVSEGQEGLVCCDSWGHKESDTIEWLNWTEHKYYQLNMVMKKCLSLSYSSFCCWLINQ